MKKIAVVLLVQLSVLLGIDGSAAAGDGNQRFFVVGRVEAPAAMIAASGVITGTGSLTAESVEFRPADNSYHEIDILVVGGGTLTVSIDGRFDVWPFTLDPRSCTRHGTLSGTWTITAGGGDFAGATGKGTFWGRFFTYARGGPAGCDEAAIKGFVAGPMVGNVNR